MKRFSWIPLAVFLPSVAHNSFWIIHYSTCMNLKNRWYETLHFCTVGSWLCTLVLGATRWATSVVSHPPCCFSPSPWTVCFVCLLSGSLSVWLHQNLQALFQRYTFCDCFNLWFFWKEFFSWWWGAGGKSMQMKVVQVLTVCGYLNIKGQWCAPIHAFWYVFIVSLSNVLPLRSSSDLSDLRYSQVVLLICDLETKGLLERILRFIILNLRKPIITSEGKPGSRVSWC